MHRWACFCNTKALLLVSPSPSTWSALHPNAPRAEKPARRWLGSAEAGVQRDGGRERKLLWEAAGRMVLITSVCVKRPQNSLAIPYTVSSHTRAYTRKPTQNSLILTSDLSLKHCMIYLDIFFVDRLNCVLYPWSISYMCIWYLSRQRNRLACEHFSICFPGSQKCCYICEKAAQLLVNTSWNDYT